MKKHFMPVLVSARISMARIVIPLCLALTCVCLSAAQPVRIIAGGEGEVVPGSNGERMSSTTPLPVGPASGGGVTINPSDYGLCGFYLLEGVFSDNLTVARIIVKDGYYAIYRNWATSNNSNRPKVGATCVHLTDFSGLPSPSNFADSGQPSFSQTGAHLFKDQNIGRPTSACIWTGLEGAFSEAPRDQPSVTADLIQTFTTPGDNLLEVQAGTGVTLSTFAICSTFEGKNTSWNYYPSWPWGGGQCNMNYPTTLPCDLFGGPSGTDPSPVDTNQYWCYIDGVIAPGPNQASGPAGYFSVRLGIGPGPTGGSIYSGIVENASAMNWNCLSFKQ